MSGVNKITADRNQKTLLELASLPGNDICADCKARTPRWASHNLGIFICMNCASIHRTIGTHITKVKSLTLDSWSREHIQQMRQVGNVKSNAIYNPDERRHPPPTNLIDSERDSELEKFIRNKYEFKTYMSRPAAVPAVSPGHSVLSASRLVDRHEVVASLLGPSRSVSNRLSRSPRSETAPLPTTVASSTSFTTPPALPPKSSVPAVSTLLPSVSSTIAAVAAPPRAASHPVGSGPQQSLPTPPQPQNVWADLQSLNRSQTAPTTIDATLPLQVLAQSPPTQSTVTVTSSPYLVSNPYSNYSAISVDSFSTSQTSSGIPPGNFVTSVSLNSGLNGGFGGGLTPFQPSALNGAPLTPLSNTPSPNPFTPQVLPQTGFSPGNYGNVNMTPGMTSMQGVSQQPQMQLQYGVPSPFIPQQQTPMFQPQPQFQVSAVGSPYMQSPSPGTPYMSPHMGGTPSPFAPSQPLPQSQPVMQQPVQGFGGNNPFTGWMQQSPGQQGGWGGGR